MRQTETLWSQIQTIRTPFSDHPKGVRFGAQNMSLCDLFLAVRPDRTIWKKPTSCWTCRLYLFSVAFCLRLPAEREGFEPPEALTSTVFKTAAIDHSAISPIHALSSKSECKGKNIFDKKKETINKYLLEMIFSHQKRKKTLSLLKHSYLHICNLPNCRFANHF